MLRIYVTFIDIHNIFAVNLRIHIVMKNITQGHLIFAGIFVVVFVIGIVYAYRKDFKNMRGYYRNIWVIIISIFIVYFTIFFLNRVT